MSAEDTVLLCDKPAGLTSHDVVAAVKRELRQAGRGGTRRRGPRVGHAGTLDPFATGLLIVLTGRATRLQRYLMPLPKTYRATARLGWRSSTGDPDGELTETGRMPAILALPTGVIRQRVPMTSAVKVGGERLYRKAHRGETVETPEREVTIYSAELLAHEGERAEFEIVCSAGTYVRTLIETLSDAYCERLRRVAVGHLRVVDGERKPITVAEALAFLPRRELSEPEAARVGDGRRIPAGTIAPPTTPVPAAWATIDAPAGADVAHAEAGAADRVERQPVVMARGDQVVAVARRAGDALQPEVVLV